MQLIGQRAPGSSQTPYMLVLSRNYQGRSKHTCQRWRLMYKSLGKQHDASMGVEGNVVSEDVLGFWFGAH